MKGKKQVPPLTLLQPAPGFFLSNICVHCILLSSETSSITIYGETIKGGLTVIRNRIKFSLLMAVSMFYQKNSFWWLLTAVLGAAGMISSLPWRLTVDFTLLVVLIVIYLIVLAAIIGYLKPDRPWQWGVASIIFSPLFLYGVFAASFDRPIHPEDIIIFIWFTIVVLIPASVIQLVLALIGAYLGAYIRRGKVVFEKI